MYTRMPCKTSDFVLLRRGTRCGENKNPSTRIPQPNKNTHEILLNAVHGRIKKWLNSTTTMALVGFYSRDV